MEDVLDVYHRPHDPKRPVVGLDEKPVQLLADVREPLPPAAGVPRRQDHEYKRNGTANVFCAFEPLGNWRRLAVTDRRTRVDWAHFVRDLVDAPRYRQAGVVDTAFNQIRQYGRESVAVTIRLLEVIAICGSQMVNDDQRRCLLRHAKMVYEDSQEAISQPRDRDDVRGRWKMVMRALGVQLEAEVGEALPSEWPRHSER